jgi:hypothetical protein
MKLQYFAAAAALVALSVPLKAQDVSPVDETTVPSTSKDLPISAPQGAVVKSLGGFYMWGKGGAWDSTLQKPSDPNATPTSQTQTQTTDLPLPTSSSATTRGAIGYVLPQGTVAPLLGSNVRTEFGLSQTTASMPLAGSVTSPSVYNGIALGGCAVCGGITGYDSSEMSAKAASDYKFDALTVSPSVTVFNSEAQQSFTGGSASTLGWRDTGAKVGVDTKVDVNKQLSLGVGGSYGRAQRSVSLSDNGTSETSPYLANGEAKMTYKPSEELSFNGFAGIGNYDNKVPGISTSGKVDYAPASNTYYGAGATWHFGTK